MPASSSTVFHQNFDASAYISARPRYQPVVFDLVRAWHESEGSNKRFDDCLDVGCGPGILSYPLGTIFKRVVGLDPSPTMLAQARSNSVPEALDLTLPEGHSVSFVEGSIGPEEKGKLNDLEDASFDFILAGTAIHWVDWKSDPKGEKIWQEFSRLLRPGGSIFFIGYSPEMIQHYPLIDAGVRKLILDEHEGLGKYFDFSSPLASTNLSTKLYLSLPCPAESYGGWEERETHLYLFDAEERLDKMRKQNDVQEPLGGHVVVVPSKSKEGQQQWIEKPLAARQSHDGYARLASFGKPGEASTATLRGLARMYHSASAWPKYLADHPEEKEMQKEGKDLLCRILEKARQEDAKERNAEPVGWDEPLDVIHPTALFVARKKLE